MSRLSRIACAFGLVAAIIAGNPVSAQASPASAIADALGGSLLAQATQLSTQVSQPDLTPQATATTFYAYLTDTDSDEQFDRVTFTTDPNAVIGFKNRSTATVKNDADLAPKNAGVDYFQYSTSLIFGENVRPGWLAYRSTLTSAVFDASFKDAQLQSMHSWFRGCTRLSSIRNLNYVDASKVMYMDWAFSQINESEMDMSTWKTDSLRSLGATFQNSTALKRLDISGWNLNGVTSLQQTFFGCTSLSDLNMTGAVADNLQLVLYAFDSCKSLPYIDISGLNLSKVTNAQSMFGSDSSLKTIVCAPGAQIPTSANRTNMFSGCSSLVGRFYGATGPVRSSALSSLGKVDGTYARACSASADGYFTPLNEYASYTVVYHSNVPGADATSSVLTPIHDVIQKYPYMANSLWPRDGYAPVAWNTAPDGGGTTYDLGAAVTSASEPAAGSTLDLYLQWRPSTYDVEYDANGGSGSIAGEKSLPCAGGANLSDGSGFARPGYTLSGWSLTPTGNVAYGLGATTTSGLSSLDGDTVVLYARWTRNSGTITYDSNTAHGGTAYTSAPSGYTRVGGNLTASAATGDALKLPDGPTPASGYYFSGWYTEPTGGRRVTAGDPVAYDAGMTLYAQFGEDVTYYAICSDTDGDGKKDKLTFTTDSTLATGLGSNATNGGGSGTSIGGTYPDYFYYKASKQFYTNTENKPGWTIYRDTLKKVEVDQSFKSVQPLHMHSYFYNLHAVDEYINLNYIDTTRAQEMDWIFAYSNAETIDLSQWNVEAVRGLGAAFRNSAGVKTIDLTGWNFANCETFSVCFDGCTNLRTLRMTGATSTRSRIFNLMFGNCKNLTYLDMTGFKFDNVSGASTLVDMFKGCSSLKTILVSPGTSIPSAFSSTSIFSGCNALSGKYIYADGTAREAKFSQIASSDSSNYTKALYGRCQTAVTNGYFTPATINNTYTIRYHMNDGGEDVYKDVATPTKSSGVTSAYPELAGALWSRTGFAALSWNTAADGSGTKVDLGSQMTASLEPAAGSTLDLYLQWQESTFKIAYDANGGLGSVATQEGVPYAAGTNLSDGAGFTRMGYTLAGWGLTPTAPSAAYDKGQAVSGLDFKAADGETVTLYAVWTPNTYRVTFDATTNATFSGAGYSGPQSGFDYADGKLSTSLSTGSSYRLPTDPPVPPDTTTYVNPKSSGGTSATVADYAFMGWYTKPEGGARVLASDIVALSDNITLYAQYDHKQQFWALQTDDDGDGTLEHMTFMGTEPVGYDGKLWTDYSTNTMPPVWSADTNATTGTKAITKATFDPSFTTIKAMSIRDWFCDFQNMTEIENIEYFDASCVLYMEAPFARCYSLKSLDLSSWNTPCVTSMTNFILSDRPDISALESLNMSGWDMRQVTKMDTAFKGNAKLTNLDLSGAKTSANLTSALNTFEGCKKLTQLDLSGFVWSGLTNAGGMFGNDEALKTIYSSMTADATGSALTNSDYMFWHCYSLKGCYYSANSLVGSTPYDAEKTNKTLARAQLYNTQSGYLTPVSSYNSATVNYHYNAPDGSDVVSTVMVIPKKISGNYGSSAPALWTYNGYKAVSWNTAADGSGTTCPLSTTFNASTEPAAGTSTELYLQWEPIKYSLSFDANGGEGQRAKATLGYDEVYSLPQAAPEFSRYGYHQVGWALSSSAQSALYAGAGDQDVSKIVNIDGADITLYAIWEGNSREITFDPNTSMGGTAYTSAQSGYTLRDGTLVGQLKTDDSYTFPNDPAPSGSEYTFCGWYTKPEGGVRMTKYDKALMSGEESVSYTYYAQYAKAADFYAVRSDSDGDGTAETLTFTSLKPEEEGTYYTLNTANCGYAVDDSASPAAPWHLDGFASNLTKVDFDVSFLMVQPQSLAGWFWNCDKLTEISHVAYLDTSRCTSMVRTFQGAKALTTLDLSTFNTPCLTNMRNLCNACTGLTSVSLSGWDLSSVDNMRSTFNSCSNLQSLGLSGVKAPAMTNLRGAFKGCAKLTALDLSGFDLTRVTDASICFAGCTNLATVLVSEGTNMSALTTYDGMFGTGAANEGYTTKIVGRYFTHAGLFSSSPWATSNNFKAYARAQSATDNGYFTAVNRYNSYTVNYHYNAPDGTDVISQVRSIHSSLLGSYATIPQPLWQYNGYKGVSWNTQPDGSGDAFRLGASFASGTEPAIGESLDLYLQWDKIVYTVRYNANGGVGTIFSEKKYLYDDIVTMPTIENSGITRDGYTLTGWSFGSNAPVAFALGATTNRLTTVDGDVVTMYAVWDKNSYPLSFDLNANGAAAWTQTGVTADPTNHDLYEKSEHLDFEGEITLAEPTREGYKFAGWTVSAVDPTASGTSTTVTKGTGGTWTLKQGSIASKVTAQWTVDVPEAASLTFNGSEQKAVEAGAAYTLSNMVVNGPIVTDAGYGVRGEGTADAGSAFVTNAGTYAVTATLVHPDTSTWADGTTAPRQIEVNVARLSMDKVELTVAGGSTYTGFDVEPAVSARYKDAAASLDLALTQGVDYEVTFANNVNASAATGASAPRVTAKAVANGNYEDAATPLEQGFEIAARALDDSAVSVSAIADQTYTGLPLEPAFTVSLVTDSGTYQLTADDFTAGWTDNTNVGTAHAVATAKAGGSNNFTGSTTRDFNIVAATIEGADVTLNEADATYDFEGADLAPEVKVASATKDLDADGTPEALAEGTHYTVQFANASKETITAITQTGSYYVVLTGANNLSGTVYVPFTVQNKTYQVSFDANGGSFGASTAPAEVQQTYSLAHVLPAAPTRDGFAFAGWFTARGTEGGSDWGDQVTAATPVGALAEGTTYYAKWDRDAYAVKFQADHGVSVSGGGVLDPTGSVSVTYDATVPAGITCDYDDEKYTFLGWTYSMARPDGTTATGTVDDYTGVHVTGAATFTAKLVETTFVAATATNGLVGVGAPATAASATVDSQSTSEGQVVSFAPVNENYELDSVKVRDLAATSASAHETTIDAAEKSFTLGPNTYQYQWVTSASDANAGSITIGTSTDPTMSLTFEVTYRVKKATYRVDVLRQDVTGDGYTTSEGESYTSAAVDAGSAIAIEPTPGEGFALADIAYASTSPVCEGACVRADGTTVVTVRYSRQDCAYQVTYVDGATPPNVLLAPVNASARYGAKVGITEDCDVIVDAPEVAGYASRSAEPVTLSTSAAANQVKVVYANDAFALTVNPTGGDWSQDGFAKAADDTFATDEDHAIAYRGRLDIAEPTREGYEFAGWNVSGAGSSVSGSTFVQGTAAATLTATWTVKAPTATELTYDGTQQVGVAAGAGYTLAIAPDASVSGNTASAEGMGVSGDGAFATHAGTYAVTVSLADASANVTWADGGSAARTVAMLVSPATNTWTTAPSVLNVTFGEAVQPVGEPRFVGEGQQVAWAYATEPDGTFTDAAPTEAGVYYARATVAGTDDFTDLATTTSFTIAQRAVTTDMVSTATSMEYTGGALTPVVTVRNGSVTLVEGVDYTLSFADNTSAGTARAIVTGMGNYAGVAERTFEILPTSAVVPQARPVVYNGGEQVVVQSGEGFELSITPKVEGVDGCGVYEYETNYGCAYATHAGAYTVTATLDGNHTWRGRTGDAATAPIELEVTVAPFDLSVATVTGVVDRTYDASPQTQRVRAQADLDGDLKLDDLNEDQHFVVSYQNNVNAAPATSSAAPTVIVTGTGDCTGEVRTTFAIEPAEATIQVSPEDVRVTSKVYDNDPATDPAFVVGVSGMCGSDDLAATPARSNTSQDVGTYEVGAAYTDNPNYVVTVVPSEMGIEARPVTITVANKSKTYGDADPAGSYTISTESAYGVVAGDDLGLVYERLDTDEDVLYSGTTVVAHAGALGARATNPNYEVTVTPGDLTIQPRSISTARVVLDGTWDAGASAYAYVLGAEGCAPYPTTVAVALASGTENVSGSNYAIEYYNSSNVKVNQITQAGSYVVRLVGQGNYKDSVSVPARVTMATPTVTFNANGGSFSTGEGTQAIQQTFGSTYRLPAAPTRPGYDLAGYFDNAEGEGTAVVPAGSTTTTVGVSSDTVLYAKWNAKTYTVDFVNDEATGTITGPTSTSVAYGEKISGGPTAVSATGVEFVGWSYSYTDVAGKTQSGMVSGVDGYKDLTVLGTADGSHIVLTTVFAGHTYMSGAATNGYVDMGYGSDRASVDQATASSAQEIKMDQDPVRFPDGVKTTSFAFKPQNDNYELSTLAVTDQEGQATTLDASTQSFQLSDVTYSVDLAFNDDGTATLYLRDVSGTAKSLSFVADYELIQTSYVVEHWKQTVATDGSLGYVRANADVVACEAGTTVSYELRTYDHFHFGDVSVLEATPDGDQPAADSTARPTGTTVVRVNYDLDSYTAGWYDEDGATLIATGTAYYGYAPVFPGENEPTKAKDAEHTYAFASWTDASGNRISGRDANEALKATGDIKLSAVYEPSPRVYSATVDANGGSLAGDRIDEAAYGVVSRVSDDSPTAPAGADWTFEGWAARKADASATGEPGVVELGDDGAWTYSGGTCDVTLYARWTVAVPDADDAAYTGSEVAAIAKAPGFEVTAISATDPADAEGASVRDGSAWALHAGTYRVTAQIAATDFADAASVAWADGASASRVIDATVAKATNSWTVQPSIQSIVYGEPLAPTGQAAFQGEGGPTFSYARTVDGPFVTARPAAVGNYYMRASVAESDDWLAVTSEPMAFTIGAASLTDYTLTCSSATYTSLTQTPDCTLTRTGGTLTLVQGTDYAVSYFADAQCTEPISSNALVDAGTYWVRADGLGNYAGSSSAPARYEILPAPLTLAGSDIAVETRAYDGTTTCANSLIDGTAATFTGAVGGEVPTLDFAAATGTYASKDAAAGIDVAIRGVRLADDTGAANVNRNYAIAAADDGVQAHATGTIEAAKLEVTGLSATNRAYDGTTTVAVSGEPALTGAVTGETPTLAAAALAAEVEEAGVGTAKPARVTGLALDATNPVNANYTIAECTLTVDVTRRPITVSGIGAQDKTYDGTTAATIDASGVTFHDVVGAEVVALKTDQLAADFTASGAGDAVPVTVTGLALDETVPACANYELTTTSVTSTARIDKATLTVTPVEKSFAYGAEHALSEVTYTGFVNGETLADANITGTPLVSCTCSATSNVGDYESSVDVSALSAPNYAFVAATGVVHVTKATVTWNPAVGVSPAAPVFGQSYEPVGTPSLGTPTYAYATTADFAEGTVLADKPTEVGTYWVRATVAGTDNWEAGESTASFEIRPATLENATVNVGPLTFTGMALEPAVEVMLGDDPLAVGTDYTLVYFADEACTNPVDQITDAGTYWVRATGAGNYAGSSVVASLSVSPADLSSGSVAAISDQRYAAKPLEPPVTVTWTDGAGVERTLEPGHDYSVGYENNVNAGTAEVTISGTGNFLETTTLQTSFRILPTEVTLPVGRAGLVYEGREQTGVTYDDELCEAAGARATDAGEYVAKVTLRDAANSYWAGGGTDPIEVTYAIAPADIAQATIAPIADQVETGEPLEPALDVTVLGRALVSGVDYEAAYESNVGVGTATVTISGTGNWTGAAQATFQIVPDRPDAIPMFRLYNPYSGEHFYTASPGEREFLSRVGWNYEGVGWWAPIEGGEPVYRLYNPYAGDHHYTPSPGERDALVAAGWNYEGVGWNSGGSVPVLRQYNPYATVGTHNFTTSEAENDALVRAGWHFEGVGWMAVMAG
ncbi:InlB B-repeat-containing protein [Olsenella intestinalis]|uniref:InlB B-repeat-containing protein n=1 Tax=Olsenella intestinalis TaxID=2930083 RepID=UPI00200C6456|nr:InlB B-repeat-containing protein [Olsenella intestinalis]